MNSPVIASEALVHSGSLVVPGQRLPADNGPPEAQDLTVQLIRDAAAWDRLKPAWVELFDASPTASAALRWEWLREWWQIYGPAYSNPDGLRIVTVWRHGVLLAVLPLYQCRRRFSLGLRRLRFLSTGEAEFEETCGSYLNLLYRPEEAGPCVAALREYLMAGKCLPWDELILSGLPDGSPLCAWQHDFSKPRWGVFATMLGNCSISGISEGFDSYLEQLSATTRKEARRLLRSASQAGVRLEFARDALEVDTFFQQLVSLHQGRWTAEGQPGCFAAPRFLRFHRTLAGQLVPSGKAVLARLVLGDKPLAVFFGHVVGSKFDLYVSGVDSGESGPVRSPGTACHLLLMADLALRGVARYDHLLGSANSYKQRFATQQQPLIEFRVVRHSALTAAHRLAENVGRSCRTGWRLLRGLGRRKRPVVN
jgi:CelD/BcsL family acetyltransferase involved in cellulose biosynthesis